MTCFQLSLIFLKHFSLIPSHDKAPIYFSLIPCHETAPFSISLIPCHENIPTPNSLIFCHELYRSNLPLLVMIFTAITIVSKYASYCKITKPVIRMYARSQPPKRPRPAPSSRPASTFHSSSTSAGKSRAPAKPRPHVNPNITPKNKIRLGEEMKERTYKDSLCNMCSDSSNSKYHHHFSSTSIRRMFMNQGSEAIKTYMCPICKILEPVDIPPKETRRVLLSSSTMYGIWDQLMPANTVHFDIDSVVGGKVRDMTTALRKNYLHMPNRLEILVIAGINNIGAGEKADSILREMEELKQVVKEHSTKWNHSPPSYVAFCTVILAPKYCTLYVPPSPPEPEIACWVPGPNFRDHYKEIKSLNDGIIELNKKDNLKFVRLDYHGVKRFKSGTVQHKFDTKPGSTQVWRETEVSKKLHFTVENKMKIVGYISGCFRGNSEEESVSVSKSHD